jgi:excisionase family DNA binding protein
MNALLTLDEVADFLKVSKDTVYRLAQVGDMPAMKIGGQWRFAGDEIRAWLEKQRNVRKRSTGSNERNRNEDGR